MVVWLLGISGAGKTTLGNKLKKELDKKKIKNYIIDGDLVRDFYNNDLGFNKEDRTANIKRIMLSAYVLEQNGIIPIVCNISPFQELRDFASNKFDNYVEIYLQRDIKDIKNKEDVYNSADVIGVNLNFDEPKNPSLIINTSIVGENKSLEIIISYLGL